MKIMYDNFEVQYVGEFNDGNGGTFMSPIFYESEKSEAINTFYTVYGHVATELKHIPKGGVEALSDFSNQDLANQLCNFLNHLLEKAGYRHEHFIGETL